MSSNQRLNATITIGSVLEQSVKKNVGFLKAGLHSVGDEIKTVERRQRELAKQRKVLEKQGKSVDALDREYEGLTRTLGRLRRAQERWNRAAGASRRVGSTFSAMTSDIGRNARRLAIGVGLAGGAIFGLASSTAQLGDDVAKTADKLGIKIGALQELRYAAERAGVSTSSFDQSLEKMQKNLGEASTGTGTAKDALEELGLSAKDLIKVSPEEALGIIADRMQGVETQAEKAALANDIFGRSGIGMLNMLRDGSRGLKDMREEARRTGYVLSEKAARDAEVFQDTLLDTQLVMKGLKNTVGAELMPVVTGAMRRVGDALIGNREQVKVWATSFADGVETAIPVIGDVVTGIGRVTTVIGGVVASTAEMVGGWENFGIVIGAVLASKTVIRIGKFAKAVFSLGRALFVLAPLGPIVAGGIRLIGAALIANPIGVAIAAIAAGAALIYTNWGKIKPMLMPIIDWMGEKFTWLWDNAGKPLLDGLKLGVEGVGVAWEGMKIALGAVIDWLGEKFDWIWNKIQPVIESLKWVKEKGTGILQSVGLAGPTAVDLGSVSRDSAANPGESGHSMSPSQRAGINGFRAKRGLPPLQTNALGGAFARGWHLTGEKGPELKFENRAGYVADNRAMRQLASHADRVSNLFGGNGAARTAATTATSGVTQQMTIHINAAGASAAEVIAILDRRTRSAAQGGLFDRPPMSGPYGR